MASDSAFLLLGLLKTMFLRKAFDSPRVMHQSKREKTLQFLSNLGAILKLKKKELPRLGASLKGLSVSWSDSCVKTRKREVLRSRLVFLPGPLICFCSPCPRPFLTVRNSATSTARVCHNSPQIICGHRGCELQVTVTRLGDSDKQVLPSTSRCCS